jgi:hypothetical protein
MRHTALFALAILGAGSAAAQRPNDTIFVVPGGHLDIGFTAPIATVRQDRIQALDQAIDLAEVTPGFAWFEEGGWSVEAWLDHYRDKPRQIARLRRLVMQGRMGVGATLLSPHAAAFPEALHLLTLHLDRIQRELGRRPTVAVVNDVPAVPAAFVDMLAAAGIHYLLMGPNLGFSAPLSPEVTRDPFYWETPGGARVLTVIDPNGYASAFTRWFLPPQCVRSVDTQHFPLTLSDDSILTLGVAEQLRELTTTQPLSIIQHALDNGSPACAEHLGGAAALWNRRPRTATLIIGPPDNFFAHLEQRRGKQLAVRRGEWGGDWDELRASEPVWTWRLRAAMRALKPGAPRDLQILTAMVTDHNVGLGPRWQDGSPVEAAEQHITQVLDLFRKVITGTLGARFLNAVPAPLPHGSTSGPGAWRDVVGDVAPAALVRAGPSFIHPLIPANAPDAKVPVAIWADRQRMLIHTRIDRLQLEQRLGVRYQAVIEVRLHAVASQVHLTPFTAAERPEAWLMGHPPAVVVSPAGVRVTGPGWVFHADGPLLLAWSVIPDPADPHYSRLQALALVHAVEGIVAGGQKIRQPFAIFYPGEPAAPDFDLELTRLAH